MELKDSMTVFLLPFHFEGKKRNFRSSSIWERGPLAIDKNAFYPHIYDFLVGNAEKEGELNLQNCIVYNLKDSWKNTMPQDAHISDIRKYLFEINIGSGEYAEKVRFRFMKEKKNLSSLTLILYPQSEMGFLMFGVELSPEDASLDKLMTLNNQLRKIDSGQLPKIRVFAKDTLHEKSLNSINELYAALARHTTFKKSKKVNVSEAEGWYLNGLIHFLLSDRELLGERVELSNGSNAHLFTYLCVESDTVHEEQIKDYVRIIRCQNKKYQLVQEELEAGKLYTKTFENIYIGSSVEGGCLMTLTSGEGSDFINQFKQGAFLTRYLWIYLLVYIQRHSLIRQSKELMDLEMEKFSESKSMLGEILSRLSILKIKSHFTDISDHTQHNSFYRFCSKNLSVRSTFDEIREKVNDLSVLIQEKELQQSHKLKNLLAFIAIAQVFFAFVAFSGVSVFFEWTSDLYYHHKLMIDIFITILSVLALGYCVYIIYPVVRSFKK